MTLVEVVARELARLTTSDESCLIAVSGGPDSLALLDLLHRGAPFHQRALVVGHVDHGIASDSAEVAQRVAMCAGERGLRFVAQQVALGPDTSETRARVARRRALRSIADEVGASAIVTAHHADDQAETVLLRVLAGTGPAGLAGIAPRRGRWVRPVLGLRRADLQSHLAANGLSSWCDPANADPRHLRSWLRTVVLPPVVARIPAVVERLNRTQRQAADARQAWESIPELIPDLELDGSNDTISVAAPPLRGYRSPVRNALLAALGRRLGVSLGARHLAAIEVLLGSGPGSRRIRVARRLEVELAFDRLTFHQAAVSSFEARQVSGAGCAAAGRFRLEFVEGPAGEPPQRHGWETVIAPGNYVVRPWRGGDRMRPLGGNGSRAVATMLREARVAPHDRGGWPVLVNDEDATIVWVPGICRSGTMIPLRGAEALHAVCTVA